MKKIFKFSNGKGFSLVELLLTMSVIAILIGISTMNFTGIQHKTTLAATVDGLVANLSQQQIKAMVGDTEGRQVLDNYGVYFGATSYTLFNDIYYSTGSANFSENLPASQQVTSTFSNSQIIFQKGSGEILNYDPLQSSISVQDLTSGEQKIIQFNRYGVITSIN